jgi:hypothetical protein
MESASGQMNLECVEIYVPKKLEYLSELYKFLQTKLTDRRDGIPQESPIDGFSIYEVDGAFYGEEIYQERTFVIRILFTRATDDDQESIQRRIHHLGGEIARCVTLNEEELWICHYPQGVVIFRP